MDRRLRQLEEAIKNQPAGAELVDITAEYNRAMTDAYGPGHERDQVLVTREYLDLLHKIYPGGL